MAVQRKFKSDPTTGFGAKGSDAGSRFYRKDGTVNIIRRGVSIFDQTSWYHTMLALPQWKFWLTLCSIYIAINLFFAAVYFFVGIEHLAGIEIGSPAKNFVEAFFFSAQTFTTVGYGRISPVGVLTSAVATLEAFTGVLSFALASGLFYGRFSKPKPYLHFSEIALLSPYKGGKALMFRTVPYKNNQLTEAEVKITLSLRVPHNGEVKNEFYSLTPEFEKINTLVLNWTIVHHITEESPLWGLSIENLKMNKAEIVVFLKAYDEAFSNNVVARTSYTAGEIIDNAKFKPMYGPSPDGSATVLNVHHLNDFELLV